MQLGNLYLKLRILAMTISGFFISCIGLTLLSPLLLSLFIYSQFIFFLIRLKFGDKFIRPGGLDVLQGVETTQSRPYIYATARYEGKVDIEKLRKKFIHLIYEERDERKKPKFRRLRQILEPCYGYHIFRDAEDFDIRNHIKPVHMDDIFHTDELGTGQIISWERIMQRFLDKFGNTPLSNNIPQWELLLLDEETE